VVKLAIKERKNLHIWFLIAIFALVYGVASIRQHLLFETMGWDLAVFDQGVWQYSQFKFPYSSFHDLPWLADHFHLILVSLAPFYWFWPDARVLLVAQAVIISLGALPLYLLAKKVTKNHFFSLVVALGYFLYYSLQWHMFSGFHELTFLPLTFGGVLYFWETRSSKFYWLFFILSVLVKEEIGLLLAAFGIWAFFNDKKRIRQAILTVVLGLIATFGLIYLVMPQIGGQPYRHLGYGRSGETPIAVAENLIANPLFLVKAFTDSPVKIKTVFANFWPWGFLPLLAPTTLILAFQQYAIRFLDYVKVIRWTPYFAYSLPLATITAWGSIYGFKNLQKILNKKLADFLSYFLIILIVFQQYVLHAPLNSIFKKSFYRSEQWMLDNHKVFSCIPDRASLSAQNSLAGWLSQREQIDIFPEGLRAGYEYVVLDLHQGQSENSFYFLGHENTHFLAEDLVAKGFYEVVCQEGNALVLKKIKNLPPEITYPFELEIYEN